jgi:regulatory protein YycI of two-component signal transduction system YycFG
VDSLFLVVWFVIAAVFLVWIVRQWKAERDRHHR